MAKRRAKKSWLDHLKEWRQAHSEFYAKQILGPPKKVNILQATPHPGRVLVMGDQGSGKTAVAHQIAHVLHARRQLPAVCHLEGASEQAKKEVKKLLVDEGHSGQEGVAP